MLRLAMTHLRRQYGRSSQALSNLVPALDEPKTTGHIEDAARRDGLDGASTQQNPTKTYKSGLLGTNRDKEGDMTWTSTDPWQW
ncbi:hypothetical protein GCM10012278_04400 [Nonomuraea glycinis]|uniref:Uncharacterized protein n=1 Tax=Nonomuraea glycinis TaxID=2047744 RepID=A0A918A0C8_9ACTN|nr:hypothetical protein GCM10012278_04400 [Nonomuraea glycinis]